MNSRGRDVGRGAKRLGGLCGCFLALCGPGLNAAESLPPTPGALQMGLDKLQVLGRVLYLAAHPDDENTRMIASLARRDLYDTAYLSLTRGGGGQNLIGAELGDALGVIRTHELLAARRIDGGEQFFTQARDFGFSKNAGETFTHWDREAVLGEVVWVIRRFQPDVILTRFSLADGVTHGHHTASAQLAVEAFEAAADPTRFPEQLEFVEPWTTKRVLWNTSSWFFRNRPLPPEAADWMTHPVGDYLPLLGQSPGEIAAASRSMHKSQGFGAQGGLGAQTESLALLAGEPGASLMDGVETSWERVPGGQPIGEALAQVAADFKPRAPWESVAGLLAARRLFPEEAPNPWFARKQAEIDRLIAGCLGLHLLALAPEVAVEPGAEWPLTLEFIQRSPLDVQWTSLRAGEVWTENFRNALAPNTLVTRRGDVRLPPETPLTQPYWLRERPGDGHYGPVPLELLGLPDNPPALPVTATIEVLGETLEIAVPTIRRTVDPVRGEVRTPLVVTPPATLNFTESVVLFPSETARRVELEVRAATRAIEAKVALTAPPGWTISPATQTVSLARAGATTRVAFEVIPPANPTVASLEASVTVDERTWRFGHQAIDYEHIPALSLFPPSEARAVRLDLDLGTNRRLGYLPGAGDRVAESLRAVGYTVELLDPATLREADLDRFGAIVLGVRAYNTISTIENLLPTLFAYAERGGVVLVQYNTSQALQTEVLAPFPLSLARGRVTDEHAAMTWLAPEHPALHHPNTIRPEDFDGWVQERGLYFADRWDDAFVPLFAAADAGEEPLEGGLLVARHGAGHFVYSGLSWFRQLPAGVPGAYRLFVNLLSLSDAHE